MSVRELRGLGLAPDLVSLILKSPSTVSQFRFRYVKKAVWLYLVQSKLSRGRVCKNHQIDNQVRLWMYNLKQCILINNPKDSWLF